MTAKRRIFAHKPNVMNSPTDPDHLNADSLISVIVPCYNVKPYLRRCIDSIASQASVSLEVIMVDDGSTDGTGKLCDTIAAADGRIRVIHKANGGLSDARNAGLDASTGPIVTFVDSDDFLPPHAISTLLTLMLATGADVVEGKQARVADGDDGSSIKGATGGISPSLDFTQSEAITNVLYQRTLSCSACGRLLKKRLFERLRFPKGLLYEDLAIIYPLLRQVHKVTHTEACTYCYTQREASITGHFTPRRTDVLDILDRLLQQVRAEAPQYVAAVQSRRLSAHFNMLRIAPVEKPEYKPLADRCWRVIKELRLGCLADRNVRFKNKLGIALSYAGRPALLWCMRHWPV